MTSSLYFCIFMFYMFRGFQKVSFHKFWTYKDLIRIILVFKILSGRVPGRAPEPSRSRVDDDGSDRTFPRNMIRFVGFPPKRYLREKGQHRWRPEGPTPRGGASGGTRATTWCGGSMALLRLSFGRCVVSGEIGTWFSFRLIPRIFA